MLNNLSSTPNSQPPRLPPTRSERAALARANFVETAKDRWNAEVEGAVQWIQHKDWVEVREELEAGAGRLWASVAGGQTVGETAEAAADKVRAAVDEHGATVAAAAARAYQEAKVKSAEAAGQTQEKAVEAAQVSKEAATSIWERGFAKSKEVADKAKAAVGLAEEKVASAVDAAKTLPKSDVEKVLQQRYQKSSPDTAKSIEEALAERYTPIDSKDNATKLRGV